MKNNNILLSLRNIAAAAVRRHATLLVAVLCLGVTFSSCRKDPIPGNGDNGDKTEQELVNEWTYDVLKFYYLWNEEVQNTVPTTYDVDYQTFLNNYLSGLTTNTLDGKTSSGGSRSLYSYISRYEVSRASSTFEPTYGFDFTAYAFNIRNKNNQTELRYFARIHYVTPDSPAANAGLKRGDWIGQIDGKKLTAANFNDINKLFAQHLPERFTLINREEDLGLEGLRQAKLSYHPAFLQHKFTAIHLHPDELACKRLWQEVFGDDEQFVDSFLMHHYSRRRMLTVELEGRTAAMLHLIPFTTGLGRTTYIYGVATDPAFRRRGLASQLMRRAMTLIAERGDDAAFLIPTPGEEWLHGFYGRFGFAGAVPTRFLSPDGFDFGTGNAAADLAMVWRRTDTAPLPGELTATPSEA